MNIITKLPGPLLIFLGALSLSFGGLIVKSFEGATLWQILFWRSLFFSLTILAFLIISYKGKTWRDGFLSSKTREFGSYAIIADTTNPSIYAFAISTEKNKFGTHKSISIKIKDNESGIDFYRGELDGKWILMEYEHKKDLLTYYPSELSKGVHTLKMIVKDKLGNETVFTKEFTF